MPTRIDVEAGWREIVGHLADHNFGPRDGDGADFQYGDDLDLRFKIGTAYSEITVTAWRRSAQIDLIRATSEDQIERMKYFIDWHIRRHAQGDTDPRRYEEVSP